MKLPSLPTILRFNGGYVDTLDCRLVSTLASIAANWPPYSPAS